MPSTGNLFLWVWGIIFSLSFNFSAFSYQNHNPALAVDQINLDLLVNADAIVRYDKTSVDLDKKKIKILRERAITVLNKKAETYLNFQAGYKKGSSEIKDIKISIYDAEGMLLHTVKKKEIKDYSSYDGYSIYTDYRLKHYEYHPTSFPITLSIEYTKISKNTMGVPNFYLHKGLETSVEYTSYKLNNISNTKINIKKLNCENFNLKEKEGVFYEVANLTAMKEEKFMPDAMEVQAMVLFSPQNFRYEGYTGFGGTWKDFGKWRYQDFLQKRNTLNAAATKMEMDNLLNGITDQKEIASRIYDFVQENTRYINVSIDEGGVMPMESAEVHKNKYGDCKALSFYYKSLLDLYDIPANYVEVYASNSRSPRSYLNDFASGYQGNHIIVQLPFKNDTTWVDCTSNLNPFGFLGSFTDNRTALAVTEHGGHLVKTTRYDPEENSCLWKSNLKIKNDMSCQLDVSIERTGLDIELPLYLSTLSEEKHIEEVEKRMFRKLDFENIDSVEIEINEKKLQSTEHYSIEINSHGEKLGSYYTLPVRLFSLNIPVLKKTKTRDHPMVFYRGYNKIEEQTIELPTGYKLKSQHNDVLIKSEYAYYEKSVRLKNEQLFIRRKFLLNEGNYPKEEYNNLRKFFNKIRKEENEELILEKL